MTIAANLLCKLLNYVIEQSKVVDPHGFKLTGHSGFLKNREALSELPGVDLDIKVQGDHVWLQVQRLQALAPPVLVAYMVALIRVSEDPGGPVPSINEPALAHCIAAAASGKPSEQLQQEAVTLRGTVDKALAEYAPLWRAWAAGEKPRRQTIDLYGDLFSLKHQL
ncbi:MAG: very short patch repair endonuclease, partial [Candidatus Saccharibacteria bacterium]|nr:very short patch repair endonuclease [Rhodoferax sp.]